MKKLKCEIENLNLELQSQINELSSQNKNQCEEINELKKLIDFFESSVNYLKSLQSKVLNSFPNIQNSLEKKAAGYKQIYADINDIKENIYEPLKQLSSQKTIETNFTHTNPHNNPNTIPKNSIESIMLKFESIKESISNQISDATKDQKLFKLVEHELVDTMSSITSCTVNESNLEN